MLRPARRSNSCTQPLASPPSRTGCRWQAARWVMGRALSCSTSSCSAPALSALPPSGSPPPAQPEQASAARPGSLRCSSPQPHLMAGQGRALLAACAAGSAGQCQRTVWARCSRCMSHCWIRLGCVPPAASSALWDSQTSNTAGCVGPPRMQPGVTGTACTGRAQAEALRRCAQRSQSKLARASSRRVQAHCSPPRAWPRPHGMARHLM